MAYKVKNWSEFQHYKDRSPSWVKLHKSLLDNYDFHCLPVASRALAPMLWLLASESINGAFTSDLKKIAFRLHMTESEVEAAIRPLQDADFIELYGDASNALAETEHDASPEREKELEIEIDKEKNTKKEKTLKPDDVTQSTWDDFLTLRKAKKAPVTQTVIKQITSEANKIGWQLEQALSAMCARGWQGFNAEWAKELKPDAISHTREGSVSTITAEKADWYRKHSPLSPILADYERRLRLDNAPANN